jgi:heme A synthase
VLAVALRRRAPRLAWTLAGLLALQLALGALAVGFGLPLALVLLHNIGAVALLLAAVTAHRIALFGGPRRGRPVAESG